VGNQGSASVSFNVVAPVTVVASLDARSSDGDIITGDDVTVRAEVTVLQGRAAVEFYIGNVLVGTDDRPPYEVRFDSSQFAPGTQTVTVVARDEVGRQAVATFDLVLVAPPTPTPAATPTPSGFRAAMPDVRAVNWGRWLGVAGLSAVLLALWGVIASALGSARRAAATKTLTPMRLALSNLGNIATGYLLRGDDPAGALFFRFSLNGQPLGQPPVARAVPEGQGSVAAGGGRRLATGLPGVTLPAGASGISLPKNMGGIGNKLSEASAVGLLIANILTSITFFLPPGLARPLRQVVMQIRKGQMLARRVEYVRKQVGKLNQTQTGQAMTEAAGEAVDELGEFATAETTREAVAAGGRSAGAAVATAASTTATGAGRAANKLYDLTGAAARQVGSQAAALVGASNGGGPAPRQWIYVPPVNPGETVTIDVLVGAVGKLTGSQHLPFRLLSRALGDETGQPVAEEGTVRVMGASPWRGLLAWIVIGLSVLVAAVLVWWLIGVIF
jgi:hypothetical protein